MKSLGESRLKKALSNFLSASLKRRKMDEEGEAGALKRAKKKIPPNKQKKKTSRQEA